MNSLDSGNFLNRIYKTLKNYDITIKYYNGRMKSCHTVRTCLHGSAAGELKSIVFRGGWGIKTVCIYLVGGARLMSVRARPRAV